MIKITVSGTAISGTGAEVFAEGNVGTFSVEFEFNGWSGLTPTAVFSNNISKVSVPIANNTCVIPWEVLAEVSEIYVAVRGVGNNGSLVRCTKNLHLGKVSPSLAASVAASAQPATPSVIDTLVADVAALKGTSGTGIHSLTEESTLADADELIFFDDSAEITRKTLWSNVKAKLKAYFDGIYLTAHQDISGKQDKVTTATVTIAVSDWSGGTAVSESVTGVTASGTVICDSSDSSVQCTAQGSGTLTFTADSTPTENVTVKVVILP